MKAIQTHEVGGPETLTLERQDAIQTYESRRADARAWLSTGTNI